jgi:hypothetical protein
MWKNYRVVAVDNLLKGRMGVAKQNSIQTSINDTSTTSEQRMWDEEGMSLSCVNAEYDYSRQSTLNTMIEQKCDDQNQDAWKKILFLLEGCDGSSQRETTLAF